VKHFNATHGLTKSTEYGSWCAMKARCCNPKTPHFHLYGGRGITVCDRWLNSFENFLADMGAKPSKAHSLDRIDNSRGYEPGNCRWATGTMQCRNRRDNRVIEFGGAKRTVAEWAERLGVKYFTLMMRIRRVGAEKALSQSPPPPTSNPGRRRGSDSHKAILTEAKVVRIRERANNGESLTELAIEHKVSLSAVWRIVKRLNWKHVA
jgi:hypothetical protein